MKYWEIIADNLSKAGWSLDYVSAVDSEGHTIWIADAHPGDGERLVLRADERAAFLELKTVTGTKAANGASRFRLCRETELSLVRYTDSAH
jgi:hypothetical protein